MEPICKNCRHYRATDFINPNTGNPWKYGYCKASRNYAKRNETDTCKRYHYDVKKALGQ